MNAETGITDSSFRFWKKVRFLGAGDDECWTWTGSLSGSGYGQFYMGDGSHHLQGAHRAAFILTNGPIPRGMHLLHRCDNKLCVNPRHLFLGTRSDNMRDMYSKGRQVIRRLRGKRPVEILRTHCKRGHPFSPENTQVRSDGARICRACGREKARRQRAEQRR